jgi:hypothetical protein
MSQPDTRSLPVRLVLACFVAQGVWWLISSIVVAAILMVMVGDVADGSQSFFDLLVDGTLEFGGVPASVLRYVLVVVVAGGLLLLAGVFVVPILLRMFILIICGGAGASYGWALVANLASWILLVAITLLFWLLPGAQPIAVFVTWAGSSVVSALLLYPHVHQRVAKASRAEAATAAANTAAQPQLDSTPTPDIDRKAP